MMDRPSFWRADGDRKDLDCDGCGRMWDEHSADGSYCPIEPESEIEALRAENATIKGLLSLAYQWEKGRYLPNGSEENTWMSATREILNHDTSSPHDPRDILAEPAVLSRRIADVERQLTDYRAENAALAKLADELSVDHRDDDTFDAGVRYALFILGFEKEAVEANDASKALRAGQQKG